MNLSEHFTLEELTFSRVAVVRGIDNTPPSDEITEALRFTAQGLERIRACLGNRPIKINSGYRCPELNAAVAGAKRSQHLKGEAVDFTCNTFGTPREVVRFLADKLQQLGVDQIIEEGGWVHVSFTRSPRFQCLTMRSGKYLKGLV